MNLVPKELWRLSDRELAGLAMLAESKPAVADYIDDPVGWCREFLGGDIQPNAYQAEAMAQLRNQRRVAIYGPHGLGKTEGFLSPLVLWFITTREASGITWEILTTAGVGRQLSKILWPRIRRMIPTLKWAQMGLPKWQYKKDFLDMSVRLNWGQAFAATADDPNKIEGVHAKHVLIVFDEAKAVPGEIFDALEGAFANAGPDTDSDAWAIAASTPGTNDSRFARICEGDYPEWWVRPVTLDDAVNAGRVSRDWAERKAEQWGTHSELYINKVLGEFSVKKDTGFIPYEWIDAAVARWLDLKESGAFDRRTGPWDIGLDPARQGDDDAVLAFYAPELDAIFKFETQKYTPDLIELGRYAAIQAAGGLLTVDAVGVGAGAYDAARRTALCRCVEFKGGAKAEGWTDRSGQLTAINKRSASYWEIFEALNPAYGATLALPPDDLLISDLASQKLVNKDDGIIRLASKADIKSELGRSPDRGDAVTYVKWREPNRVPRTRSVLDAAQLGYGGY